MAEALGAASAITTFVALALKATVLLCQTVQSVQSRERLIRELSEELQDLSGLLKTLQELNGYTDVDLTALENPLKRCADACTDFNDLVMECTQHSSEDHYSKRDWLKIRYMGEDISGFRNMLAGYKSTIIIALAYVNLRTTKITKHVLGEYKELIQNKQCDLETHLEDIRTKVETLSLNNSTITRIDPAEFCKHVGEQVNQPRMNYYEDITAGDNSHLAVVTTVKDLISAKRIKSGNGSKLVLGQMSDDTMQSVFINTMGSSTCTKHK